MGSVGILELLGKRLVSERLVETVQLIGREDKAEVELQLQNGS